MKKNIFILLFCLVFSVCAFAHAMFLDLIEPGVFKVEYDGGGFSPGTIVTLYSDGGFEEIQKGEVDENGLYHFDKNIEVVSAMAEDGAGHVAYWPTYEEEEEISEAVNAADTSSGETKPKTAVRGKTKRASKLPTVLTVLNTCALIYLFFEFRRFKKERKANL